MAVGDPIHDALSGRDQQTGEPSDFGRALAEVAGIRQEIIRVLHESIKPDPLFKMALKTGAKGQVQWEIEYSGTDPKEVERVIREAHSRLTETFGGAPAEFSAEP